MPTQKPLVLVADDEQNAVMLLKHIFERDGFEVESAENGVLALEKARELRPDLILMDVQMPKMSGFEVTERLREQPETERIPVIFVTAAAREPSDVAHGFQLGADDYVRKPYDYHELLARAHSKMRARQLEDRLQRRSDELEALVRIGGEFNQRLGLDELTELIVDITCDQLEAEHVELYLLDEQGGPVSYQDSLQGKHEQLDRAKAVLLRKDTIINRVFVSREPILVRVEDDVYLQDINQGIGMAAPLKHHGEVLGILFAAHGGSSEFGESNFRMLRSIGEQAALAVRNAQLHAALQSYAQNLENMVEQRTQELRAAQDQLVQTEKLAALGRLAAGVAHEVNNPLQPVLTCLEGAIEDVENEAPVDLESLRVAESEVQRIKSIVSRLLDFARPSTSDTVPVQIRPLVEEVIILTKKQLERARVNIDANLREVPMVKGSPTQLKQVLLNLVLNAMESMPEGGVVSVGIHIEGNGAAIEIADTGEGMDEHTISQIFEPFYSTKDDGTGLGLSVSYGIIQGHGGNIRVESEPGVGSKFTVWLPYFHN
ncbi:MAG: response regulator [Anaerolineae bacterium]|nr:response regulator [Anaerolineae bacterium]